VAVNGAIATLLLRGHLLDRQQLGHLRAVPGEPEPSHALERRVRDTVAREQDGLSVVQLRACSSLLTRSIARTLSGRGLLSRPNRAAFALALVGPIFGGVRLASRIGGDYPVAFLITLTALGFVLAWVAFAPKIGRTPLDELTLMSLRERHGALGRAAPAGALLADGTLPWRSVCWGRSGGGLAAGDARDGRGNGGQRLGGLWRRRGRWLWRAAVVVGAAAAVAVAGVAGASDAALPAQPHSGAGGASGGDATPARSMRTRRGPPPARHARRIFR
jgi:uncharacterized protein (TIGR04222 family)